MLSAHLGKSSKTDRMETAHLSSLLLAFTNLTCHLELPQSTTTFIHQLIRLRHLAIPMYLKTSPQLPEHLYTWRSWDMKILNPSFLTLQNAVPMCKLPFMEMNAAFLKNIVASYEEHTILVSATRMHKS